MYLPKYLPKYAPTYLDVLKVRTVLYSSMFFLIPPTVHIIVFFTHISTMATGLSAIPEAFIGISAMVDYF